MHRPAAFAACLLLLQVLAPTIVSGHSEKDKARYVAAGGADTGRCDNVLRPCASIAYAVRQANKGDRVLVAEGEYRFESGEDLFLITSGLVPVYGGYDRFDHFQRSAPDRNPTVLVGVPAEMRGDLARAGFHVIADGKGLAPEQLRETRTLLKTYSATQRSHKTADCAGGIADGFACDRIDLLAHLALRDFSSSPSSANDIWGFVDLNTDREYVLIGLRAATAVVDVTDPANPVEIGSVPGPSSTWRDIKVLQSFDTAAARWRAYAYVTTDQRGDGLRIIDLTGLPNSVSEGVLDAGDFQSAHNVYLGNVDYATGVPRNEGEPLLHVAGANRGFGQFRSFTLTNPLSPMLVSTGTSNGYMHDGATVSYTDARRSRCANAGAHCDILVDFNEDAVELWDVSDASSPTRLGVASYTGGRYVHSGWASEDGDYFFVQDELDESDGSVPRTTLRVFSLDDPAAPSLAGTWTGPTQAIDHNGYVRGNRYYMSNYTRGLTVLDITDPAAPRQSGFFDTYPVADNIGFNGAWGVYPYLPSGVVAVSDINSGLYLLRDATLEVAAGGLSFSSAAFGGTEGATVEVVVERGGGQTGAVTVDYEILSAGADAGDLVLAAGTLRWADQETGPRSIPVALADDGVAEPMERALLRLANPGGGATLRSPATASLFIADPGAQPAIRVDDITVEESAGIAIVTVRRVGGAAAGASVEYLIEPGTATAGADFGGPSSGRLDWPAGDGRARTIVIPLVSDGAGEGEESFVLRLINPAGASLEKADALITVREDPTAGNRAPLADAGSDRAVDEGVNVVLDGRSSSDPDDDQLSYAWSQLAGGPRVALSNAGQAEAGFIAPDVAADTRLGFRLQVTDPAGATSIDEVSITVRDKTAPAAGAGGGGGGGAALFLALLLAAGAAWRRMAAGSARAG